MRGGIMELEEGESLLKATGGDDPVTEMVM
jgi:hypothetical protein